jgi:HPt (histidine-containing phosphotransfer) domain-containing protein
MALWVLPDELRQLAESGDGDLVKEVLAIFRSDTSKRLAGLRAALSRKNRDQVKHQAHAMKGSAGQVGAGSMAALCQRIESQALTAAAADLENLVSEVEHELADVSRAMDAV